MNSNLFTLKYWFGINAGSLEPVAQKVFVVFLVLLLALAIYSKYRKREKGTYLRIWTKMASFGTTNLIIGIFLLFFTYEAVAFLSARFWFLLWLASMIIWLNFVYKDYKKIPELLDKRKKEEEFKKYIP